MNELIKVYDVYSDFERRPYFTLCFNNYPSVLKLDIPLKESKENMESVLQLLDLEHYKLTKVYQFWVTEDSKDSDFSKDYPYEYLFKSETSNLLVWVTLEYGTLIVEFLYDLNDNELEKWIIDTNHKLRVQFGEKKSPMFKVLSQSDRGFHTDEVKTSDFNEIDIAGLYNDDFNEIDEIIKESMKEIHSGLILLHGKPGTGKTTYIKHLMSVFNETVFIFIQNEFVKDLLNPAFISFLLKHKDSILVIEDAEKVISSRENISEDSVVSTILQLTDGLFSDFLNIKIICTFNTSIDKVDKALLRKGRMIAKYEFENLSVEKSNILLEKQGFEASDKELSLADIFGYHDKEFNNKEKKRLGFV